MFILDGMMPPVGGQQKAVPTTRDSKVLLNAGNAADAARNVAAGVKTPASQGPDTVTTTSSDQEIKKLESELLNPSSPAKAQEIKLKIAELKAQAKVTEAEAEVSKADAAFSKAEAALSEADVKEAKKRNIAESLDDDRENLKKSIIERLIPSRLIKITKEVNQAMGERIKSSTDVIEAANEVITTANKTVEARETLSKARKDLSKAQEALKASDLPTKKDISIPPQKDSKKPVDPTDEFKDLFKSA